MYKPNDSRRDGDKHRVRDLATIAAVAAVALAGLLLHSASRAERNAPPSVRAAAPADGKPGTYQLRCWQYGRLLFEEGPVTLAPESRQAAKLVAFDRYGAAVIVTDTGGTTCMARPSPPPPNLALPR